MRKFGMRNRYFFDKPIRLTVGNINFGKKK